MSKEEPWIKGNKESILLSLFAEIMKEVSTNLHHNSNSRTTGNKDCKEENFRKRQEQEGKNERFNRKMILEYELQRACKKDSRVSNEEFLDLSRSNTRSVSVIKRTLASNIYEASLFLEQDPSTETVPKYSESMQIGSAELHKIKIDIHRNASLKTVSHKLQKDINDLKDVLLKKKSGEGFKPIYKSDNFKNSINRKSSPRSRASYLLSGRNRSKSKSNEDLYKKGREYTPLQIRYRYNRFHHRSPKDAMPSREYRGKSRYRSDERRDRSRRCRDFLPTIIKHVPVPVPVYYGNLPQNQTMIDSTVHLPAPDPVLRGKCPMGPVGLFPPRFIPPTVYRSVGNSNKQTKIGGSVFYNFLLPNRGEAKSFDNQE